MQKIDFIYQKIKNKLNKNKVLLVYINKKQEYKVNLLKKSINEIRKVFNIPKENVVILNINDIPYSLRTNIIYTPFYFVLDSKDNKTIPSVIWADHGYFVSDFQ